MVSRLFLVWVLLELAVVVALVSTIGLGWTLLVLLSTFVVGVAVAGSQLKRRLTQRGPRNDGVLVTVGALLVAVPGLVSTVAGLLLLLPPTRVVARPLVSALAARSFGGPLITVATFGAARPPREDVIDGEVIDVTDVDPVVLPPRAE